MLDQQTVADLAADLHRASQQHTVTTRVTARHPSATIDDAYAIQRAWCDLQLAAGRRRAGGKIGLTSRAMQRSAGITEPDYGVIFADTVHESGAVLPFDAFTSVRVEVELAFVLGRDLAGPDCTVIDVMRATEYVVPALEVLDSRFELAGRTVVDTISDNAAYGATILGGTPVEPQAVDLRWVAAMLYRNEVVEETGVAAGVLNHPAAGPAWLANRLHRHGERLRSGEVVLAGSFTRPTTIDRGDSVFGDYGPLGTVTCRFT